MKEIKQQKKECTNSLGVCCSPLKPSVRKCKHCGYFKIPCEIEYSWNNDVLMVRDRDGSVSIA
jgi:hypothetical protein